MHFFISFLKEKGYNRFIRTIIYRFIIHIKSKRFFVEDWSNKNIRIDGGKQYEGACKYTNWKSSN